MPEGHTLHRLAHALDDAFAGTAPRASSPQGRFVGGAAELDGLAYGSAFAHGKHLFVTFGADRGESTYLHVHLGLIGTFRFSAPHPPVGQVRLRLATDTVVADLRGPILCALRTGDEVAAAVAALGPDPLRPGADAEPAWTRIHRSGRPVAALLMDQTVLAGVGNVYRAEVLFRSSVDPYRPGRELRRTSFDAIWEDLTTLMPQGVRRGRIETLRADDLDRYRELRVDAPPRRHRKVYVYRRAGQPCYTCGTGVSSAELVGRNLFWCRRCQRRR